MPDYNGIAWFYDGLARVIFGKKQTLAKQAFLDLIPASAKVLIIGGGSGKLLEYLNELNKNLLVDFVEISSAMISKAKNRSIGNISVTFHHTSILTLPDIGYDVIITNFFFDQFSLPDAQIIMQHLQPKLKQVGIFIFSDFISTSHRWDKFIESAMFLFFGMLARVRAKRYPQYNLLFKGILSQGKTKIISRNIIATCYVNN